MKIKTFKNQIKNESYDIPDVLEKIKPIAYTTKYHTEPKKHVFFKNLLQLVPVMTIFTICLLVLFNLERAVPQSEPKNYPYDKITPEDVPSITQFDIFNSYLENSNETWNVISNAQSPNASIDDSITKECSSNDYCMWKIDEEDSTIFVVDKNIFDYLLTYIKSSPNCTLIDAVNSVKNEFSISDDKIYAVSDAYHFIKNNLAINN